MGIRRGHIGKFNYKRHEPEKALLYRVLAREWDTWFAECQADTERSPLPAYVEREAYFRCRRLKYERSLPFGRCEQRIAFGECAGQKVRRIGRGFGIEEEIPIPDPSVG